MRSTAWRTRSCKCRNPRRNASTTGNRTTVFHSKARRGNGRSDLDSRCTRHGWHVSTRCGPARGLPEGRACIPARPPDIPPGTAAQVVYHPRLRLFLPRCLPRRCRRRRRRRRYSRGSPFQPRGRSRPRFYLAPCAAPTLHKGKSPRVFECKITQAEESAKTSPTWREVRHLVLETPLYPP